MSGTVPPCAVAFDFPAWVARYPEFRFVSPATANAYFAEAGIYLDNTGRSPVRDLAKRAIILGQITAHIAALAKRNEEGDGLVGRISNASEGSVSVAVDNGGVPGTAQWWQQTIYGASAYQATNTCRTFRFFAGAGRRF